VRFAYPADVISQARATADWLFAAVTARQEPFGSGYQEWLRLVTAA
jgi:hypothetical protein